MKSKLSAEIEKMRLHARQRHEAGERNCSECFEWKECAAFSRPGKYCDACRIERQRKYIFEYRTGMPHGAFEDAIEEQGDKCLICSSPFDYWNHRNARAPVQDHKRLPGEKKDQRAKGSPRGVLCRRCNMGLGQFGDDPTILRAAADYLDKWSANGR